MWCFDTVTTHPWGDTSMYVILLALVRRHNEIKRKTSTSAPGSLLDSSRFLSPWSASPQRARIPSKTASAPRRRPPRAQLDPPNHVYNLVVPHSNPSTATAAGSLTGNSITLSHGSPPQPNVAIEQPAPESPADLSLSVLHAYDLIEVLGPEEDYMDLDEPEPAPIGAEMGQDVEMASIVVDEDLETGCAETMEQL
ncbi:hypothetical protein FRC07_011113 [Ceratobasidium sp. 392]|nr:hypothetical protein FRC07_011113 [Ceratobasidium sp. 392]